jgi:cytochrome c-type biogenesis protein CcmH
VKAAPFVFWLALAVAPFAYGATAQPTAEDPVANERAVRLQEGLRCLVCQNQTIAESNAELAQDLRRQVNEQIAAGRTDQQIVDYMVERYGDFVLYRPPVKGTTLLLWFGPMLLLVGGLGSLVIYLRSRRGGEVATPLSEEERKRAEALLAAGGKEPT